MKVFIFIIFLVFSTSAFAQKNQNDITDINIVRLKPSEFESSPNCPKIPQHIVEHLEKLQCTIPQSHYIKNNHNAFQIEFARRGQFDWAFLCSRNEVSSILIFWNGLIKNVGEFAKYPDKDFIRAIDGTGKAGFSRAIGKDTKDGLFEKYKETYGDIFHEINNWGIDEVLPDWTRVRYHIYKNQIIVLEDKTRVLIKNL